MACGPCIVFDMTTSLTIQWPANNVASSMIGLFDSGLGGLAVVRELLRLRPDLSFLYLADQFHAPYGPRPVDEVRQLCDGVADALAAVGCAPVVLACHTASAAALYSLREAHPERAYVGMEPAVKPACEHTATGEIGVLATSGTLAGKPYAGVVQRFAGQARIATLDCREFVDLVEQDRLDDAEARGTVAAVLRPFLDGRRIDHLVLACTHYSFLKPLIQDVAGDGVHVVDPCEAVARQTLRVFDSLPDLRTSQIPPRRVFITSGDPDRFSRTVRRLLDIDDFETVQGVWR